MGNFLKLLKSRKVMLVLAIVIVAMLALAYYQYIATEQVDGKVDHKGIMGVLDDTSYTLVMYTPYGLSVDSHIRDLIPKNATDLTIPQEQVLINELRDRGYSLHFVLNVEVSSHDPVNGLNPGDTLGYFVEQDVFTRLNLGDIMTFEVPHNEKGVIRSVR
jgi:hypothetical protein